MYVCISTFFQLNFHCGLTIVYGELLEEAIQAVSTNGSVGQGIAVIVLLFAQCIA